MPRCAYQSDQLQRALLSVVGSKQPQTVCVCVCVCVEVTYKQEVTCPAVSGDSERKAASF